MDPTRIAALLAPFLDRELSSARLAQISTYIHLLIRWNSRINLTAIRQPEEIVTRHFGESFFLARHLFPLPAAPDPPVGNPRSQSTRVLDIGSGAGFPALPLKIWDPRLHLNLIESNHKKAIFLREVCRALTLTDVDVYAERAETLPARFPKADLVTFRAVEKFDRVLPLAASFLSLTGRLAVLIGSAQIPQLVSLPPLKWQIKDVPQSQSRVLAVGSA